MPRSTFKVKVRCLHDDALTFADVWSIPAYNQFIAHIKPFLFVQYKHLESRTLQTFLSGGHISHYTIVRGPDVLRNVIVSGYVTFSQIKYFANRLFFYH